MSLDYSTFTEFQAELFQLFEQPKEHESIAKNGKRLKLIKYLQNHVLQSLFRRCWLEKQDHLYCLPAVIRQYITDRND
ncbi:MAG: hypothetical protein ACRC78_21120 [Planktothrix sp.]